MSLLMKQILNSIKALNNRITNLENNKIDKTVTVATTGTDLNDYTSTGFYYFSGSYTPTNIPAGSNGWLLVLSSNDGSSGAVIKQLWFRYGTINSNDHNTFVRTKSDQAWGDWKQFTMS